MNPQLSRNVIDACVKLTGLMTDGFTKKPVYDEDTCYEAALHLADCLAELGVVDGCTFNLPANPNIPFNLSEAILPVCVEDHLRDNVPGDLFVNSLMMCLTAIAATQENGILKQMDVALH